MFNRNPFCLMRQKLALSRFRIFGAGMMLLVALSANIQSSYSQGFADATLLVQANGIQQAGFGFHNCIFVNTTQVAEFSGTISNFAEVAINIPGNLLVTGDNVITLRSGNQIDCTSLLGNHDDFFVRNVRLQLASGGIVTDPAFGENELIFLGDGCCPNPSEAPGGMAVFSVDFHFQLVDPIPITLDIKPGSFPNSINLGSGGTTAVAILGLASLDVNDINPDTLTLGTAGTKTVGKTGRTLCSVADVSGEFSVGPEGAPDGFLDLVCHFITMDIVPEAGNTTATISGELNDTTPIQGTDSVNIVP